METFTQPKITGYRQSPEEAALMNEAKALAVQCGEFVAKLRALPTTNSGDAPRVERSGTSFFPSLDQRWVAMGASDLQVGFMKLIRGIAQPATF
jgi:hypothetical protein